MYFVRTWIILICIHMYSYRNEAYRLSYMFSYVHMESNPMFPSISCPRSFLKHKRASCMCLCPSHPPPHLLFQSNNNTCTYFLYIYTYIYMRIYVYIYMCTMGWGGISKTEKPSQGRSLHARTHTHTNLLRDGSVADYMISPSTPTELITV